MPTPSGEGETAVLGSQQGFPCVSIGMVTTGQEPGVDVFRSVLIPYKFLISAVKARALMEKSCQTILNKALGAQKIDSHRFYCFKWGCDNLLFQQCISFRLFNCHTHFVCVCGNEIIWTKYDYDNVMKNAINEILMLFSQTYYSLVEALDHNIQSNCTSITNIANQRQANAKVINLDI